MGSRTPSGARRAGCGIAATCALFAALLVPGRPAGAATGASVPDAVTKTVTRTEVDNASTVTVDSRNITLSVAETAGLRGFQQIDVSWTGARPSGGVITDVNLGTKGVQLEYPMVLLECRGVDAPTAAPADQLTPSTCWTAYESSDRGLASLGADSVNETGFPPWRLDMYATADQRAARVGAPDPATVLAGTTPPATAGTILSACSRRPIEYWVPFVAADLSVYYPNIDCNAGPAGFPEPPEAAGPGGSLSFPSNETFAESSAGGTGSAKFDVLTANENASLGCSDTVACALVAVPVMGISCDPVAAGLPPEDQPSPTQTVVGSSLTIAQKAAADCTAQGNLLPGQSGTPAQTVTGQFWWAPSNWRNRITVPLSFAPVADPCSIVGGHQEVDVYGSELMVEATAQWDPHFCKDPSLFTLKHVQGPEPEARNHLEQGLIEAAYASRAPAGTYSVPVVKAPVALTGFGIAFSVDDNAGNPVTSLRLDPRLLAKLLTESYPTNPDVVRPNDPGLQHNPLNVTQDPEFVALNPEFGAANTSLGQQRATTDVPSAATLYALASDSDVMYALTSYIMGDPEARSWMQGAPDPWGMVVNPHYNLSNQSTQISLPTEAWQLEDTFTFPTATVGDGPTACKALEVSPYLGLVASPVSDLYKLAQATEFTQPFSTNVCGFIFDPQGSIIGTQPVRVSRTPPGSRFMLALVSLGDAQRYDLQVASLQSQVAPGTPSGQFAPVTQRSFVGPSDSSLRSAARLIAPDSATGTWQIPDGAVEASPSGAGAYPGAMVVSTQVPTSGLAPTDATNLSKFLQFAAGPGQTPGSGFGQLPPGYLPMTAANGMGALAGYTQAAADAVAAQAGAVPPLFPGDVGVGGTDQGGGHSRPGGSGSSGPGAPGTNGGAGSGTSAGGTATSSATPGADGSTGGTGSSVSIGPTLRSVTGPGDNAVLPPTEAPTTLLGKTVRIISGLVDSLLRWLFYLALLCAAVAGALYAMSGRGRFENRNLGANVMSRLAALLSRRRLS